MKIMVTLELDDPHDLNEDEIEKDLRMSESAIGWNYDYKIVSVELS